MTECLKCDPLCENCESPDSCSLCDGYIENEALPCEKCISSCRKCTNNYECIKYRYEFYLDYSDFKIYKNGRYTLIQKSLTSSITETNYKAIMTTNMILFLTLTGFILIRILCFKFASKSKNKSKCPKIIKYHLFLSIFIGDHRKVRHIKYLWFMSILNIQIAMQEVLILLEKKFFNSDISIISKAFFSVISTLPLHAIMITIKNPKNKIAFIHNIFVCILTISATIFTILCSILFIKDYQDMWVLPTILSFSIEFCLETILMIIRSLYLKYFKKKELDNRKKRASLSEDKFPITVAGLG